MLALIGKRQEAYNLFNFAFIITQTFHGLKNNYFVVSILKYALRVWKIEKSF